MVTLEERMAMRKRTLARENEKKINDRLTRIVKKSMATVGVVTDTNKWQGELLGVDCDYLASDAGNDPAPERI